MIWARCTADCPVNGDEVGLLSHHWVSMRVQSVIRR